VFSFQSFVQANIANITVKGSVPVDSADWKRRKKKVTFHAFPVFTDFVILDVS